MAISLGFQTIFKGKKLALVLFIAFTLLLILSGNIYPQGTQTAEEHYFPWLLESGLVEEQKAEIHLSLWFNGNDLPPDLLKKLPKHGWAWQISNKTTTGGSRAVALAGHRFVNYDQEIDVNRWFSSFRAQVEKMGGHPYLDERVAEVVDPAAYLASVQAQPRQWILSERTSSIAAYRADGSQTVQAGPDRINVQVLTRPGTGTGQSVLALPALLEEF